jgi:hypothetical protein
MKVIALKGFVHFKPDGDWLVVQPGQVLEMPEEADWLKAGLVLPAPKSRAALEKAVLNTPEKRRGKGKK